MSETVPAIGDTSSAVGGWEGRARFAAVACLFGAGTLVAVGVVAGIAYSSPSQLIGPDGSRGPGVTALLPSHYAAFARATVLLGGANSVSAVLVLVAVLLVVVSGDAAKQRPRVQDWAAALGMVVAFGAVVMAAMTIWYYTGFHQVAVRERLSVELRSVGALVAAALIAGAASWWALAGRTA